MKRLTIISLLLLLLLVSHVASSRSIRKDLNLVSDGVDSESKPSFLELSLSASTEMCEPTYGFLPCSSNLWGLLFLIVVYEILLSLAGKCVAIGSRRFFRITGIGRLGANLFQFLQTVPQIVLVLVSALSGSMEAAQQRATLGMGLVAGTTVMLLTLIWGLCVVAGSSERKKTTTESFWGVETDSETSRIARWWLRLSLIPFLILLLAKAFNSSSGRRVIILVALITTVILFSAYILCQILDRKKKEDWRSEFLKNNYVKDKILRLFFEPDEDKILELFGKMDKSSNGFISAHEIEDFLKEAKRGYGDNSDPSEDANVFLQSFDLSGDNHLDQDEFVRGMTELVHIFTRTVFKNSQDDRRSLSAGSNTISIENIFKQVINFLIPVSYVICGTIGLCILAEPLIKSVVAFSQATNLSSFWVSYLAIPLASNFNVALQSVASAKQKTQKSISLTLTALYGSVYMNNMIGMMVFLAPVYARNLSADVFVEVLVVMIICILMTLLTTYLHNFARWIGCVVLLLYPISLALIFLLTSVLGWS